MNSQFLNEIKIKTQTRLDTQMVSLSELRQQANNARAPHAFLHHFKKNTLIPRIIAEVKFASPAYGRIAEGDPVAIARQYIKHGARAISVLTEPDYFFGSLDYLKQVRDALPNALLLMKDFVLGESQLLQARIYGADAVLLIVAFLSPDLLRLLYQSALKLGLTPLVEVHTLEELKIAEALDAQLIGINNRNLQTLIVDLQTSSDLITQTNGKATLISESGIKAASDILSLQQQGFDGFLIGSQFMHNKYPGKALGQLISGVADAC